MKRSRYVVKVKSEENHILYNIRTGRGLKYSKSIKVWDHPSLQSYLVKNKFLIQDNEREDEEVLENYKMKRMQNRTLHLIILPHENCNFRCVYCYEKFERNKMLPEVEQGLKKYIAQELASGRYKHFTVSWFGGEPLLGIDVMERLSAFIIQQCEKYDVHYSAGITTNGYLITKKNLEKLDKMKVYNYQVTIDGVKEVHDQQRIQKDGSGTYDTILKNLITMKNSNKKFRVLLRMNVSPDNYQEVEAHIKKMEDTFEKDSRFELYFHNIGHWGGENDDHVEICKENMMVKLLQQSSQKKIPTMSAKALIKPDNVCYAADPKSFVIGTDGTVYKCTVALYDERNQVGQLTEAGNINLDQSKFALWVDQGIADKRCGSCYLAPSCHGDSCPLIRMQTGSQPCPDFKNDMSKLVEILDIQGHRFDEVKLKQEVTSDA
ncbi:radical SAM/SPASM domain-containing protein [Longirhabdus pacifica]|uniref:radical SAM/SPASM domain-containing protein n=1 Tax=Longirhabdus pacifica TaxID=2305227 RepID=UPI001008842A|nr:radical SAM protein [Longirhabdus pacifica]